ncbi:MAG: hypothetical protein LBN30_05440 [Oscillospiraceae bacterium]|jgi:hypothetical protein|nr:hypothetical protein [Oscillospiraceae bacterium]
MTFSKFAHMLYPFCGDGKSPADFVVALIGSITEETETMTSPCRISSPITCGVFTTANGQYHRKRHFCGQPFRQIFEI